MNAEEAKVPDVDGHWQSIDIFLFSNGQQYTPPRKYRLRADELNLWDDTLDLLAQSHYGPQSPVIDLYTIDGRLVEGPLELKDGLAYVAVTPPDTFIDAGYQKYLIRASRSWEKRQARKKIPESVPEELCCLCPEKVWCCDIQTCCLCPEKEDEEILESLYCAAEHPELRPAGGHFMRSAPSKLAAADDYRTRSGKIAPTADEHAVRLCEYGPSPAEFGYSPVESPAKPDKSGARLLKHGENPSEHTLRVNENGSELKFRGRTDEYGASPGEFGTKPDENVPVVSKNGVEPAENGARPGEYAASFNVNGPRLSKDGARLREYGTKQGENAAIPAENGTRHSVNRAKPNEHKARPGEYKTRPSINGAKPRVYGVKPGKYETRPSINRSRPSLNVARPEYDARPSEQGARPGEYKTRRSINEDKPSVYETKPTVNGARPSEYKARPVENETRTNINGVKPNEYGTKPAEYETKLGGNGAKPNEYEATPGEYKTRPTVNVVKPIEYKARPSEYKTRPAENRAKPSEYKARPDENRAKTSEYKARPGKNETRPSVNGSESGNYGATSSINGAKPDEYGVRPGEYESRPKENGAKPGEYRARSGEFGDKITRSNEYGPKPTKDGVCSDGDQDRPTVYEAIPGNDGPYSNEIESKKEAYDIGWRPNEISSDYNVDRLDKDTVDKDAEEECKFRKQSESELEKNGKYGVTQSDQSDKQIDPKCRASGNGVRGGARRVSGAEQSSRENDTVNGMSEPRVIEIENAHRPSKLRASEIESKRRPSQQRGQIEHTRKLSRQAGSIEQGGRTGELNREFEHGDRVSGQKGREINAAGRARVNSARLSEQRNKQSDHLARLGGRESRVGDHEARAGDLGLRTSNRDAGLVNPASKVADTSTRTAVSGSRASPRHRTTSIAKTSNLGQPKLRPPGRVDETATKLGESEIKNRVGYPVTRQSNVGGAGAAGASHMFEAQQHARRTSLSAGRRTSIEKKPLSIGQNTSLLKKPTAISSVLRKSEDKQPIKTNKEILLQKKTGKVSAIPVPASNDVGQSKTMPNDPYKPISPPALPPSSCITNLVNIATNKAPLEIIIDEREIIVVSTHLFREPESEIRSMRFDSVKQVVGVTKNSPEESQTELLYVEKSMTSAVNEGVQTNTEPVEQETKNQEGQGQKVTASGKAKVNSCTCTCALCCKRDYRLGTVDPDENIISIQNKGDVIKIKLKIEVRNIARSVYPCQKNVLRSRSLTNFARSEKQSQISIDDGMIVRHKSSLQSILNHQQFRGYGFEGSPKVMVVQCAGCGRLNYPPPCDQPSCCDNNKQYFILLANSENEDMDHCCNFNPPCRSCDLRQSQLRKLSSGVPIKQILSEIALDTITTVTVSGVPLQRRQLVKTTDRACQTEEPQGECMTKHKVSILEDSGTRCDYQKESGSSISVTTQVDNVKTKHSCRKICPQKCVHEDSQVYSEFCPPVSSCQKLQSVCSQVSCEACPQIQSKGCQQTGLPVQSQGCMPVSPKCSPCCPKPLPCIQVQTQVCPQVPQVSDAQTQTHWSSIVAQLHPDGRYSFHLPPLNVLNSYPF